MAVVRPFSCVRPAAEHAAEIAALPYDVYNREEAKREVKSHPLSFLAIDRPETDEIRDREGAGAGGQGNRRWLAVSYRKRERQDRRSCDKKEERNVRENAG